LAGWTAVSGCDGWQADGRSIAQGRDGFQAHVARTLHGPLIILFEQQGTDQSGDGSFIGEDADDVAASLDCDSASKVFGRRFGVGPWSRTGSGGGFDQVPGVLFLELHRAQVAKR